MLPSLEQKVQWTFNSAKDVSVWIVVQSALRYGEETVRDIICAMHVDSTTKWMAWTGLLLSRAKDWWVENSLTVPENLKSSRRFEFISAVNLVTNSYQIFICIFSKPQLDV